MEIDKMLFDLFNIGLSLIIWFNNIFIFNRKILLDTFNKVVNFYIYINKIGSLLYN